ncbi:SH3 domain-containing protein [Frateuria hangzhouensis]|uniref:C40 family peptidase n=1 Tax=Frateuria hangzhouensis TaxID=2995589 RepID=UPI002260EF5F|nr:SH3 domain-containing protein [Frateuria sp. STR12]MCX7512828.1 SH3 domain-containing protein [Frateuria sp. STR12]
MRTSLTSMLLALALAATPLHAREQVSTLPIPPSGVLGVGDAQLTPQFWIGLQAQPDKAIMSRAQIDAQNAALFARDKSMHELRKLPATLSGSQVRGWIGDLADPPTRPLYDVEGKPVPAATLQGITQARALDAVPASQKTRYGMVVRRAALRTFPTTLRVFREPGDTDIDRFQETAEFPGTPVVIAHATRDGRWLFVVSPRYAAWTEAKNIAEGSKEAVFAYVDKTPYRIVTGAKVHTVFTREAPAVSQVELDMGTRVPVLTDLPPDQPVNGQTPYATHVVELPVRKADGSLAFSPALIQKNADTAGDYLPLTPRNLITQAFKFLGERYGWGHAYDGRDCSGFVSDVYRSLGVQMPRNTSSQGVSPAFAKQAFTKASSHEERLRAAKNLKLGDLIYIPGHVMMSLGQWQGQPWVIHDVGGMRYRKADGSTAHVKLNAVSVTPLLPMLYGSDSTFIDRMTSIVRMRP